MSQNIEPHLYEAAADIIQAHAEDIEFMSIGEMHEELTEDEQHIVDGLISEATVTITWPAVGVAVGR